MASTRPQIRRGIHAAILALCAAAALLAAGCQSTNKSPERVQQVRDALHRDNPGALIGRVIYTLTEDGNATPDKNRPYTAVGDVPVQDIQRGGLVAFVDPASGKSFNSGAVADIYTDSIGVRYDPSGKRPPMRGDLAVVFKEQ
jgi:hypothetical protein